MTPGRRVCVAGCRRLMEREAILAGGSSGGVLAAVEALVGRIPAGAMVVALLPDRGERYLDHVLGRLGARALRRHPLPLAAGRGSGLT